MNAGKEASPGIIRFMFERGLFELTIANLEYVYREILGNGDPDPPRTRNYTTLRSINDTAVINRIEREFALYLNDVLLQLPENSREDDRPPPSGPIGLLVH